MEEQLRQITIGNSNCIKVVLYGPESTGKTSLAEALANYYKTVYVEEFSRRYAEMKMVKNQVLTKEDVLPIAAGQMQLENEQYLKANKVLICDTDLLETKVYSEFYYDGFCPELVKKYALENTYDLYFLTYIDTPWEADGVRDLPNSRRQMFDSFENALIDAEKKYMIIKGRFEDRLETCITQINQLLNPLN